MLVTFLIFALLAVLGLVAFLVWMWPSSQRPSTVPGMEPSDPNLGNLSDIQKAGSFHEFLVELHAEFGPVASFYYGQKHCVSLGSAEALRHVENCFDRPLLLFEFVKPLVGPKSVQYANGSAGREVHRTMAAAFSHRACADALPKEQFPIYHINSICAELTRNWASVPAGEHLPLRDYMMALAIRIISSTHFGAFFRKDDNTKALHKLYETVMDAMDDMLLGEFDPEIDKERNAVFQRDLAAFQAMVGGVVGAHRAARREGDYEPAPFLDAMLDQYGDDEEFLASNAITVMVGGFHTTGNFLTWVLYYMAIYPHMQEKVFEEIQEVLGPNSELDIKSMDKLKYLNAFLSESHRHANIASFVAKEWATPGRRIAGHLVPEGTPILLANTVAFLDEKYFPDPRKFDPSRFLDEAANRRRPSTAFAPFSFGPRKCVGYRLAHFESVAAVVAVVRKFAVRTAFEDDFFIEQTHGFVCKPASEVWVKIKPRS